MSFYRNKEMPCKQAAGGLRVPKKDWKKGKKRQGKSWGQGVRNLFP
jgi:hypothetical protein